MGQQSLAPNWGCLKLIHAIGDTKAGTFIAKDRYGNSYYENLADELPC